MKLCTIMHRILFMGDSILNNTEDIKVKSLKKAIEILNCFAEKPNLKLSEISEMTHLYKSNVFNILSTFKAMEYVGQDPQTGTYYLDVGIFRLNRALNIRYSIGNIAMPYMQSLANTVKENVFIAIPNDDNALYLDAAYPMGHINMIREMKGKEAKMYCTGLGKAMMAYLPQNLIEEYTSRELKAFTDNTITEKATLIKELEKVRTSGYALDNMEHEFGVKCVAVPLFYRNGKIAAGMSITGKASDIDWKREHEGILLKLKECALSIQAHL